MEPVIKRSDLPERQFEGGAVRDSNVGKGRFDLLCPFAIDQLARHMQRGCERYGDRNWELGIPMSSFYDSADRHMKRFAKGETDEDHLLAAFWNLHCAISTRERIKAGVLSPAMLDFPPEREKLAISHEWQNEPVVSTLFKPTDAVNAKAAPSINELEHDKKACLMLCDSMYGSDECDSRDFTCGDAGCAKHLFEKLRERD